MFRIFRSDSLPGRNSDLMAFPIARFLKLSDSGYPSVISGKTTGYVRDHFLKSKNQVKTGCSEKDMRSVKNSQHAPNGVNPKHLNLIKKIKSVIPPYIVFLSGLLAIQLVFFQIFRLIFLYNNFEKIDPTTYKYFKLVLFYGISFDVMVSCFILLIPFILLSFDYFFELHRKWFYRVIKAYLLILIIISFLICSADIPFYTFFNSRLTKAVLLWKDNFGGMMDFILNDRSKYPYFLLLLISSGLFILVLFRLQKKLFDHKTTERIHSRFHKLAIILTATGFITIGLRGGVSKKPLTYGSLAYTNHYFINQLSWNPVLSFLDSFRNFSLNYLNETQALLNAGRYLGAQDGYYSPIARSVKPEGFPVRANVVLVLMESMSTEKVGVFGNKSNLTPHLDKLARESLFFTDFYTSGIHSCNGVFGTLFSFPSIMGEHPMNSLESSNQEFSGLYNTLVQHDYQTAYICTHDESFDNVGYFIRKNGCRHFYSKSDFPKEKIVSSWGVPDETLFDFSLVKLNEMYRNGAPFFATLVTISTHEPYVMPGFTEFRPGSTDKIDQLFQYADWSIGRFIKDCERQPWFSNTIFVFAADHGINAKSPYHAPLSFHHSPLIIYGPGLIKENKVIDKPCLQTDIFPTIMGLLKLPYVNNTFGVDILNNSRPFAYFTHDDKLGCISDDYYLIVNKTGERFMHKYRLGLPENFIDRQTQLADSMQTYAMSMLQTAQWMLLNKRAGHQVPVQ